MGVILYPKLLHVYGSLNINSFGLCLAFGLIVFIYFISKDSAIQKFLLFDEVVNLTVYATIIGVISGRLLYMITDFYQFDSLWDFINISNGGSSVLGAIMGTVVYVGVFAYKRQISPLALLDIGAIYVPIIHSISRLGCFLAGCCYGCETGLPWAITYTNPETVSPLFIPVHPTQLYSSAIYFFIFLFMYFNFSNGRSSAVGLTFSVYLILASVERLLLDFIRGDRVFIQNQYEICKILSFHQLVALAVLLLGLVYFVMAYSRKNTINI